MTTSTTTSTTTGATMKKLVLVLALAAVASPVFAFMTLKSCTMVNTMSGARWLGTYCNASGECVKVMFSNYCPYSL
jgi:hypothetical protein